MIGGNYRYVYMYRGLYNPREGLGSNDFPDRGAANGPAHVTVG